MFDYLIEQHNLQSGARLINIKTNMPISIISAWFRAGSCFDPVGKEGLAHFFEHLLMSRTKRYPTQTELTLAISREGINRNATTYADCACYYYKQSVDKTLLALDFLLDGLNSTPVLEDDIAAEYVIIADERIRKYNNPMRYLSSLSQIGLWPGKSLGRPLLGTEQTLQSITLDDFLKFKENYYQPCNAVFVAVSNEDPKKIIEKIERGYIATGKTFTKKRSEYLQKPSVVTLDQRTMNQVAVAINFRTAPLRDEAMPILDLVASYYFTNSWISQLVRKMRLERDFSYWVNGGSNGYFDTGFVNINYSTEPQKLCKSIEIVFEEINKLKNGDIRTADLDGAKALARLAYLTNTMNPYDIMMWYGRQGVLCDKVCSINDYLAAMLAVTPTDIQRVARKYLIKENLAIALIGPVKEEDILKSITIA